MKNNKKGFTLIEMMIVIAVVAVLVSIIIPVVTGSTVKAAAATNAANLRSVAGQVTSGKLLGDFTIEDATFTYYPENEVLPAMGGIEAPNAEECCAVTEGTIMWVQMQADNTALCTYQGYGVDYFAYIAEHGKEPDNYEMTESNKLLNDTLNRFQGYKDSFNNIQSNTLKGILNGIVSMGTEYEGVEDFLNAVEKETMKNNGQIPEEYAGILNQITDRLEQNGSGNSGNTGTGTGSGSTGGDSGNTGGETPSQPSTPVSACSKCSNCTGYVDETGGWFGGGDYKCDNCNHYQMYH